MSAPRKVLIALGFMAAVLVLGVATLPFLVDVNRLRPIVQAQLEKKLHVPVSLEDMQLKRFPLAARVSGLVIGQPDGFASSQPLLRASEVYVGVALWPLLHKEVNIDSIRLRSPSLEIVRNPAGIWNYETATAGFRESGASRSSGASGTILDELRIEDGQVTIDDQKAATHDVFKRIDLTVKGLGPDRRGSLAGSVRLDTMAAVLNVRSDFDNRENLSAKGTLSLKSDRNKDTLRVAYDLRRGRSPAPLIINSLTASIGKLSASATGSVDIERSPAELQVRVKMANAPIADLFRLAAVYGVKFPAGLKAEGILAADVKVTGTAQKPILAGSIDASKAQISAKELVEPVNASELHIDFTPNTLTTRPFRLETGATRIRAQATMRDYSGPSPQVVASLQTDGARIEELLRIANAYGLKPIGLNGSGIVTLDLKIAKAGEAVNYAGSGSLRNVSITSPQLPKPLTVSVANVGFSEDQMRVDHLQASLGSMHLEGAGSVRDFHRPDIQFAFHVDQLSASEMQEWGHGRTHGPGQQSREMLDKFTATGSVTINKVIYDRTTLNQVKANVSFAKSVLKLDPISALAFGGQQSGSTTVDLCGATPAYAIKAKLSNVDANQFLTATTSVKDVLYGTLAGAVDVHFLDRPNETIAKSLNGKVQFQMGQGRIAGVQILNEIANIGRFVGYSQRSESYTPISKLSGSFNMQSGLASTNDLFMDLGGATLSGAGTIGLVDQSLKLHVTTVLSKDFAQRNVPGQIGGLLTTALANQKGELIVPAIVTGTFAQPKFAPDVEQIAKLKLKNLLPTGNNPAGFTSGLKGLMESVTGKQPESKPTETKPAESKPDNIFDLFKQLGKEKDTKKP